MDSPTKEPETDPVPRHLSPSSSGRRTSNASPEFEFWMVRNPVSPQPELLSADELFVDGVLLPLHLLHLHPNNNPEKEPEPDPDPNGSSTGPGLGPRLGPDPTASKRWKDIFKKGAGKKKTETETERTREKKSSGGAGAGTERININIWPFSRSRSAGNGATRPRTGPTRKVSSAPCSRSNSAGESKSRKWPSSPGRVGVHLGRTSPVWQVRKPNRGSEKSKLGALNGGGAKARVLNLNVPTCIGYRQHVACRSDESGAVAVPRTRGGEDGAGDGPRGSNLFNLRSLFVKKVY